MNLGGPCPAGTTYYRKIKQPNLLAALVREHFHEIPFEKAVLRISRK